MSLTNNLNDMNRLMKVVLVSVLFIVCLYGTTIWLISEKNKEIEFRIDSLQRIIDSTKHVKERDSILYGE